VVGRRRASGIAVERRTAACHLSSPQELRDRRRQVRMRDPGRWPGYGDRRHRLAELVEHQGRDAAQTDRMLLVVNGESALPGQRDLLAQRRSATIVLAVIRRVPPSGKSLSHSSSVLARAGPCRRRRTRKPCFAEARAMVGIRSGRHTSLRGTGRSEATRSAGDVNKRISATADGRRPLEKSGGKSVPGLLSRRLNVTGSRIPMRKGAVARTTKETSIEASLDLDGSGISDVSTGVGFFDHMLDQLARHSLIDMTVRAVGDRHIDDHHTVEDVGIALGQALAKALDDKKGLARYADCLLPMDETLTRAAVDVSGRPLLVFR